LSIYLSLEGLCHEKIGAIILLGTRKLMTERKNTIVKPSGATRIYFRGGGLPGSPHGREDAILGADIAQSRIKTKVLASHFGGGLQLPNTAWL